MPVDIADPRTPSATVAAEHVPLFDLAQASLAAASSARAEEIDRALAAVIAQRLRSGEAPVLADVMAAAPSVAIARQLWRGLIDAWALASRPAAGEGVAAALFAVPVVVVAGREERADAAPAELAVAGVLGGSERLCAILREHGALGRSQMFGLGHTLVAADAVDLPRWSALLAWQNLAARSPIGERDLPPTPIVVQPGQQSVHLRFLIGTAIIAGDNDVFAAADRIPWAMPFAQELVRQLATPGLAVLALPRMAQSPPAALQHGRAAQREVGAQLFASNAIRKLRAAAGEPVAVISAHRCAVAPGGGELRVSLSCPLDSRQAEGFRCPLFATDRVGDVAAMWVDLLRDCRVAEVHVFPGVHPDRDATTGMPLLFKADADALAASAPIALH